MTAQHARPVRLGKAGARLWESFTATYMLEEREAVILAMACRQADAVAELEEVVEQGGVIVAGANGQPRISGAVTELRLARLALTRLLGSLSLPSDDDAVGTTLASQRAQRAARARWSRVRRERGDVG